MLDVVVCSLVIVLPALALSLYWARLKKNYLWHKRMQIGLCSVLLLVVVLFEADMRLQGGFWKLAKNSPYAETLFLHRLLGVHLCFSVSTVFLWTSTIALALKLFPNPPGPSRFSPKHKAMAWIAVADMTGTVVTGLMVYYYGFWVGA